MTPTETPECCVSTEDDDDPFLPDEIGEDEVDHEGDGQQVALAPDDPEPNLPRGFAAAVAPPVGATAPFAATLAMDGPFIKASGYRSDRSRDEGKGVRLIALHTAEGATDEVSLGRFFERSSAGSSHGGVGQDGGYAQYVRWEHTAWTNPPVSDQSDTLEICGFAGWSRATWLKHPKMLDSIARWIAWRSVVRGIPIRRLSGSALRTGKGVADHKGINDVYHASFHWDVGPGFPWDVVLRKAQEMGASKPLPWRDANLYPARPRVTHKVIEGETLAKIGRAYRCPIETIKRLNTFERGERIRVGQTITVADLRPTVRLDRLREISVNILTDGAKAKGGGGVLVVEAALDAEGLLPEHDRAGYWGRKNAAAWLAWEERLQVARPNAIVHGHSLRVLGERHAFKVA
jgi:hypothetical protein